MHNNRKNRKNSSGIQIIKRDTEKGIMETKIIDHRAYTPYGQQFRENRNVTKVNHHSKHFK